jgi:hypothetical protein
MNIYKISQTVNRGWDTYDEAVVCAESKEDAVKIHPNSNKPFDYEESADSKFAENNSGTWAKKEFIEVELLGTADESIERGVIVASFHAG